MDAFTTKIVAVGLTLGQLLTTGPDQVKTTFDPKTDQAEASRILTAGCAKVREELDLDNDDLSTMVNQLAKAKEAYLAKLAKTTPDATVKRKRLLSERLLERVDGVSLAQVFERFCKGGESALDLTDAMEFYNRADLAHLPDVNVLKNLHLPETSLLLDREGKPFTEIYSAKGRRKFVSLKELPPYVKQAFVSAEDQYFLLHSGIDMIGILRAVQSMMSSSGDGRDQGASTISQQVIKNLLLGEEVAKEQMQISDLTYLRKIKEMILAARMQKVLSKDEILELYLNYIFLGRASWGIEMAAQSYFGKSARQLTIAEAAMLAALPKNPTLYDPARRPEEAAQRRQYVLKRLAEDDEANAAKYKSAMQEKIATIEFESPLRRSAFYFIDEIQRQAKRDYGIPSLTSGAYRIKSTIHHGLQKSVELALQDGLSDFERTRGIHQWTGPEGSIAELIAKSESDWQEILPRVNSRTYFDIRWQLAVVLQVPGVRTEMRNGRQVQVRTNYRVGLKDGSESELIGAKNILATLKPYDLIFVTREDTAVRLRVPPKVQGAAIVLENKTGRVLGMTGGFSYAASNFNRVTLGLRQPGSTIKPFLYLAGLQLGYQPNTILPDVPITFQPIAYKGKSWSPVNYDRKYKGQLTARQALEASRNVPAAHLLASMADTETQGLDYFIGLVEEFGLTKKPDRVFPMILGTEEVRLIDLAAAYATIANIANPPDPKCPTCLRPVPRFFDSIEQNGQLLSSKASGLEKGGVLLSMPSIDRVALFQLRRMMEGVLIRGTASGEETKGLRGTVAGKTGTTNSGNDAWFVGFTNDITVAVWVGYDKPDEKPRGATDFTGADVALPIAARILRDSFAVYHEAEPLRDAPSDVAPQIAQFPIDGGGFEAIRKQQGYVMNTQDTILRRDTHLSERDYSAATTDYEDPYNSRPRYVPQDPEYRPYYPGAESNYGWWSNGPSNGGWTWNR